MHRCPFDPFTLFNLACSGSLCSPLPAPVRISFPRMFPPPCISSSRDTHLLCRYNVLLYRYSMHMSQTVHEYSTYTACTLPVSFRLSTSSPFAGHPSPTLEHRPESAANHRRPRALSMRIPSSVGAIYPAVDCCCFHYSRWSPPVLPVQFSCVWRYRATSLSP